MFIILAKILKLIIMNTANKLQKLSLISFYLTQEQFDCVFDKIINDNPKVTESIKTKFKYRYPKRTKRLEDELQDWYK
jgi:hypothetical protein